MAEPVARAQLDELADTMNALLVATCETFQQRASLDAANALAAETAARLKPLVARAGAVINGYDLETLRRHDHGRAAGDRGRAVRS